jgi:hypothetical protein
VTAVTFNEGHPALDRIAGEVTPQMLDNERRALSLLDAACALVEQAVELTNPLREAVALERNRPGREAWSDEALFAVWRGTGIDATGARAGDIIAAAEMIDRD